MRVDRAATTGALLLGLSLFGIGRADLAPEGRGQAADASAAAASLRLSGIVMMGGEPRVAVLEAADGGGWLVRVGDTLPDGTKVLAIGPDWARLSVRGEEQLLLRVAGLPADPQRTAPQPAAAPPARAPDAAAHRPAGPPAAATSAEGPPPPDLLTVEGHLGERIARVAAAKPKSVDAVAGVISDHLGLPSDTAITITDFGFRPFASAAAAKAALDQGSMLRVQIGSGEEQQTLYLAPPQATAPAGGGQGD